MQGLVVPTDVNIMALTATATKDTRKGICKSLDLLNSVMIIKSPEKSNIIYKVIQKTISLEEIFTPFGRRALTKHHKNYHILQYTKTLAIYIYFFLLVSLMKGRCNLLAILTYSGLD